MSGSQTQPPENSNTHMDQMHNPVQGPGYDEDDLGNTKIAPLDSPLKEHTPQQHTHGVVGEDYILQSSHIDPFSHNDKTGPSQHGGHHKDHHDRRDQRESHQHHEGQHHHQSQSLGGSKMEGPKTSGSGQQKQQGGGGSGTGMDGKTMDHGKGGMPMRKE